MISSQTHVARRVYIPRPLKNDWHRLSYARGLFNTLWRWAKSYTASTTQRARHAKAYEMMTCELVKREWRVHDSQKSVIAAPR